MFQAITNDANGRVTLWHRELPHIRGCSVFGMVEGTSNSLVRGVAKELEDLANKYTKEINFDEYLLQLDKIISAGDAKNLTILSGFNIDDRILFYTRGNIRAYFIDRGSSQIADLSELANKDQGETSLKFVTGTITNGKVLFVSSIIGECVPMDQAIPFITQQENGLWNFKQSIVKKNSTLPFGILVCGYSMPTQSACDASMKNLINTAARTEQVLESPLLHVAMPIVHSWFSQLGTYIATTVRTITSGFSKLNSTTKSVRELFTVQPKAVLQEILPFADSAQETEEAQDLLSRHSALPIVAFVAKSKISHFTNKFALSVLIEQFNQYPLRTKLLILGVIVGIFALTESILITHFVIVQNNTIAAFEQELNAVSSMIDEAQSNIIFKNESQSKDLLARAEQKLAELNKKQPGAVVRSATIQTQMKTLHDRDVALKNELRHVVAVDTTKPMLEIPQIDGTSPAGLFIQKSGMYVWGNNQLLRIDTASKKLQPIVLAGISSFSTISTDQSTSEAVFTTDSEYRVIDLVQEKELRAGTLPSVALQVSSYNNKLFFLNQKNEIFKLSGTTWQPWLTEAVNLSGAKSFTIDGDIFFLMNGNTIVRVRAGKQKPFSLSAVDPPIQVITNISTTTLSTYLYALEPAARRLLVFKKDGSFVTQYTVQDINTLVAAAVDEQNKKLYLLGDKKFFSIPATHIGK